MEYMELISYTESIHINLYLYLYLYYIYIYILFHILRIYKFILYILSLNISLNNNTYVNNII